MKSPGMGENEETVRCQVSIGMFQNDMKSRICGFCCALSEAPHALQASRTWSSQSLTLSPGVFP